MTLSGMGASIMPSAFARAANDPALVIRSIGSPRVSRDIAIVTLRGQSLSPAATRLAALVSRLIDGKADVAAEPRGTLRTSARGQLIAKSK